MQIKIHLGGRVFFFKYSVVEAFQMVMCPVQHSQAKPIARQREILGLLRAVSVELTFLLMRLTASGICVMSCAVPLNFSL